MREDINSIIKTELDWEKLKNKTVLVAGASGFIASYIVEVLLALNNIKVLALVRNLDKALNKFSHHKDNENLVLIKQDISESFEINEKIDFIIHAASQASPHYYGIDPVGTLNANVLGTSNLLKIAIKQKVEKFLYLSSGAVYGVLDGDVDPVDETYTGKVDITNIRSCYDESKRMGENMCVCYSYQYKIPVNMVRISYAYGPGMALNDSRIFASVINDIIKGENIVLNSDGSANRDFCYITDMVKSIFLILLKGKDREAYNVAYGKETSILELVNTFINLVPEKNLSVIINKNVSGKQYIKTGTVRANFGIQKLHDLDKSGGGGVSESLTATVSRMSSNNTKPETRRRVIIIGANSNIAKALTASFSEIENIELVLYTTNIEKTKNFVSQFNKEIKIYEGYTEPLISSSDLLINCIGVGTPKQMKGDYTAWFTVLEKFDNLCIDYIKQNLNCLYISLSSGSIYGSDFSKPVDKYSKNTLDVNNMGIENFYSISKIYSEAKHRAYNGLNIVDLRIFSFFSRYSDIYDGYFMSDLALSILNKETLKTNDTNIIRDYIHISDLTNLILLCLEKRNINAAFDVISKEPISKFEILENFKENFGLKYEILKNLNFSNSAGSKNIYYSINSLASQILNYKPQYSSLEALSSELFWLTS